jgi:NADH-quinone oxidoreductase subunit N
MRVGVSMTINVNDLYATLPVLTLTIWASVLLLLDVFVIKRKGLTAFLAAAGLALSAGFALMAAGEERMAFNGMAVSDGFSTFFAILFALSGLLGIGLAYGYNQRMDIQKGEYYVFILFSVTGMMLMAQAANLIVVFLALELLSIPLYILSAFAAPKVESEEAGLKYFLLGAFSTGFVVYGIALVYGATGSTELSTIVAAIAGATANFKLMLIGAALILVGFGFKVAAVPFHMWTPDVYQGAPTSVTAFMAAGAKAAGFAALLRVFVTAFPALTSDLSLVLTSLAVLTMFVGNVIAISQTNIKRMLAYSSIAQAGYILLAFLPYGNVEVAKVSVAAALFYLLAYTFASFGSWGVVIALEQADGKGLEISDFAGLARKRPVMAAAMAIFMLSLTGMPPTLGLVGKFYLFRAAIDGGFYIPAVIGILTSLISAYYYLRVIIMMYMREGDPQTTSETWLSFVWGFSALATVVLSLVPQALFSWASQAVLKLF